MRTPSVFRLLAALTLGLVFGGWLTWTGWRGLQSGEVLLPRKFSPDYIAYAVGPHSTEFQFEVWTRIIVGSVIAVACTICLFGYTLASPERRKSMLTAVGAATYRRNTMRVPTWLAIVILTAFVGILLLAAIRIT